MLKNVTLSADETLIERARQRAEAENTTLNAEFRRWLAQYAERPKDAADFQVLMARLSYVRPGSVITRKDLNER